MNDWQPIKEAPTKTDLFIVGNKETKGVWIALYFSYKKEWRDADKGSVFDIFEITHWREFPRIK